MPRRIIWIVLALIAVVTAGFLFAVLVPRHPDEQQPPAVVVDTTITIQGDPAYHSTDQASRAFRRAGLPVTTAFRVEQGKVVYPKGGAFLNLSGAKVPDMIELEPRRGGRFAVYVYDSETAAIALVTTAPTVDPVRGLRRTMLRDSNVVVIVEPPRSELERRIRTILNDF